jgi:hypothetical protein
MADPQSRLPKAGIFPDADRGLRIGKRVDGWMSRCIMRGSADETSAGMNLFFDSARR